MKRIIPFLFLIILGMSAMAQSISVADFQLRETDMTAASLAGRRVDQNGQPAALIRIETTETGFVFEAGALGIVDSKQETGEVWVWVPRASRKITIKHPKLGVLYDYRYPLEIEAERTYWMKLTTGKVITTIQEEVRMQYLAFQITPPNAVLMVNDELWEVSADGTAMRFVNFGTYTYRVQASNYLPEAGRVVVDDPINAQRVPVNLQPDFVQVTLKVDADAEIWVNDEKKGIRSWTGPMGKSSYKIECKQAGHETVLTTQKITAEMDGQTITLPVPRPIYGSLNVESRPFATLYIDGKVVGATPYFVPEILVDQHEIKLVKEGYADHIETITIAKGERKQVKATLTKKDKEQPVAATTNTSVEDLTFEVNGVSFTMKFVESGSFLMGGTTEQGKRAKSDEKPVHLVTLDNYYIGETEVTQDLWIAVMGNNLSDTKGDNLPVNGVSWSDCQEFIYKLNQATGKSFRLPTEAEWEYAARGGRKSKGYIYAGSDIIKDVAICGSFVTCAHAIKTKLPNELGLYDMSGNVYEWCKDYFGYYIGDSQTNPQGPSSGSLRICRGGCGLNDPKFCRVSYRKCCDPDSRSYQNGFRLALSE